MTRHGFSRRDVLGGACAGLCARSLAAPSSPPSSFGAAERDAWTAALDLWRRAEAEVEALGGSEDQDAYDDACGRHDQALAALLGAAAPDGAAAAGATSVSKKYAQSKLRTLLS